MDIGTGKDLAEYVVDGKPVPYHLIDVAEPGHLFSVFEFQQRFYECFRDITARGRMPIVVGGTGLYIESVLREYRMLPVPENKELREELKGKEMEELAARLLLLNPALHNTTDLTGGSAWSAPSRLRSIRLSMDQGMGSKGPTSFPW